MALRRLFIFVILALLVSISHAQNAAPVMSSANISSTQAVDNATDQNLTIAVASTDADGDSVTYAYNW